MKEVTIDHIVAFLEKEEWDCGKEPATEELPDRVVVYLGEDSMGRDHVVEIALWPQILVQMETEKEGEAPTPTHWKLVFSWELPFEVEDIAVADTARMVSFVNSMVELPGFELRELEGTVGFRTVAFGDKRGISGHILMGILGNIYLMRDMHMPTIERVASGAATMNDLLDETAALTAEAMELATT